MDKRPVEYNERDLVRHIILSCMDKAGLSGRERKAIMLRYGADEPKLKAARAFDITTTRFMHIERKALYKIWRSI